MTATHVRAILFALLSALLVIGCVARPPTSPGDAMPDSAMPTDPRGPSSFTLELLDDDVVVGAGERVALRVRIVRSGGFDAPVLVELPGLPDVIQAQARESRAGDDVTTLTLRVGDDVPSMPRTAFVVQASSEIGLRQSSPAHVTIR